MKILKVIGIASAAAAIIYAGIAPFITVYQMKLAAENRDGEALVEHVDFPAVRQSLKDQFNAVLGKQMAKQTESGNPFAALGAVLGGALVERAVDIYMTPAGLIEAMRGEALEPGPVNAGTSGASNEQGRRQPFDDARLGYDSLNKFTVRVPAKERDEEVVFVLRRQGLGWKLTDILLPMPDIE